MTGLPFRYGDLSQLDEHEVLFCDVELTAKVGNFDIGHRFSSAVLDCSAGVMTFDEYSDKGAHSFDFQLVLSEAAESQTRDEGALFSSLSEEKLKAHSDAFKERTGYTPNQFVLLYRTKKMHRNDWGKVIYSHAMEIVRSEQALQTVMRVQPDLPALDPGSPLVPAYQAELKRYEEAYGLSTAEFMRHLLEVKDLPKALTESEIKVWQNLAQILRNIDRQP